jgi:tripartite-type tricarboxylate transporter receptor subunit TctC
VKGKTIQAGKMALLFAVSATIPLAHSASWPEKPVRMIIPWAPGGGTDIVGRLAASELSKRLKQQVIVDNRGGAGGIVGMQLAAQAPADGYTLLFTSTGYGYLINKASKVDLVTTFIPVALIAMSDAALTVSPSLPVKSTKELIALAKARPGELFYASSGVGGFPHMNTELFKLKAGVNLTHVPFRGSGPAAQDVMAGNTQVLMGAVLTAITHSKAGRLKLLATGGSKRNPQVPDVPTISETVPGYESYIWWGVFAPRGTPPAVISHINAETNNGVLASPDLIKTLDGLGAVRRPMSTGEFGKFMAQETAKWTEVINAAGITEQ